MSYQTGTALHVDDLLLKLSVFAQANGWTEDKAVAGSGDGASSELYLSKGSSFFQFQAQLDTGLPNVYHGVSQNLEEPFLNMYGSTGFLGTSAVDAQPGTNGVRVTTNWLLPNFTAYHFFTDSTETYLHVVVEVTANEFRHMQVGVMEKIGAFTGGEYVQGSFLDQATSFIDVPMNFQHGSPWINTGNGTGRRQWIRVDIDGTDWKIAQGSLSNPTNWLPPLQGAAQGYPLEDFLETVSGTSKAAQPNTFNSTLVLFPIPIHIVRSASQWTPVGKPFDMRMCNIENVAPSSTIVFGGDDWLVFPVFQKKSPEIRDDLPNSGFWAIAYKKIP